MGGRIWCRSVLTKGSTFGFSIKCHRVLKGPNAVLDNGSTQSSSTSFAPSTHCLPCLIPSSDIQLLSQARFIFATASFLGGMETYAALVRPYGAEAQVVGGLGAVVNALRQESTKQYTVLIMMESEYYTTASSPTFRMNIIASCPQIRMMWITNRMLRQQTPPITDSRTLSPLISTGSLKTKSHSPSPSIQQRTIGASVRVGSQRNRMESPLFTGRHLGEAASPTAMSEPEVSTSVFTVPDQLPLSASQSDFVKTTPLVVARALQENLIASAASTISPSLASPTSPPVCPTSIARNASLLKEGQSGGDSVSPPVQIITSMLPKPFKYHQFLKAVVDLLQQSLSTYVPFELPASLSRSSTEASSPVVAVPGLNPPTPKTRFSSSKGPSGGGNNGGSGGSMRESEMLVRTAPRNMTTSNAGILTPQSDQVTDFSLSRAGPKVSSRRTTSTSWHESPSGSSESNPLTQSASGISGTEAPSSLTATTAPKKSSTATKYAIETIATKAPLRILLAEDNLINTKMVCWELAIRNRQAVLLENDGLLTTFCCRLLICTLFFRRC